MLCARALLDDSQRRTVVSVTPRRLLRIAALLFATVTLEEAYAAPRQTIANLRATACCAGSCRHKVGVCNAAHCCELRQATQDPATVSKSRPLRADILGTGIVLREGPAAPSSTASVLKPIREVFSRPAPIFLLDRSLRL